MTNIIPTLKYKNAPQMIDWLGRAFGFEKHAVYADGDVVHHAQLVLGAGMIMVSSAGLSDFDGVQVRPTRARPVTRRASVVVPVAAAPHARAVAAGAEIVRPLVDADYGGRGYTCRDPEGHVWSFGTYDPWKVER